MSPMTKQITAKGPAVVGNLSYTPGAPWSAGWLRRAHRRPHGQRAAGRAVEGRAAGRGRHGGLGPAGAAHAGDRGGEPELKLEDEVKPVSAFASRALRTVLNKHLSQIFTRPRGLFFLARLGLIVLRVGAAGQGLRSAPERGA